MKITRTLEFDAAHRVVNHESKCANLHGHRYKVEIEAESDALDDIGRVIDFSVIKQKIGGWIDENWDHTAIINLHDPLLGFAEAMAINKPVYKLRDNPTAENMASYLLRHICPGLMDGTGIRVCRVTIWETPNCRAEDSL